MNPLNQPTVSRSEFRKALNIRCNKEFGMTLNDLPDIINIDDNWWPDMIEKEAIVMIDSCIEEFREELEPNYSAAAPIYSIDE
jgi:hypothetical protein